MYAPVIGWPVTPAVYSTPCNKVDLKSDLIFNTDSFVTDADLLSVKCDGSEVSSTSCSTSASDGQSTSAASPLPYRRESRHSGPKFKRSPAARDVPEPLFL